MIIAGSRPPGHGEDPSERLHGAVPPSRVGVSQHLLVLDDGLAQRIGVAGQIVEFDGRSGIRASTGDDFFDYVTKTNPSAGEAFNSAMEGGATLQALALAHELQPDAVLMDLYMPALDGIEAARLIKRDLPEIDQRRPLIGVEAPRPGKRDARSCT